VRARDVRDRAYTRVASRGRCSCNYARRGPQRGEWNASALLLFSSSFFFLCPFSLHVRLRASRLPSFFLLLLFLFLSLRFPLNRWNNPDFLYIDGNSGLPFRWSYLAWEFTGQRGSRSCRARTIFGRDSSRSEARRGRYMRTCPVPHVKVRIGDRNIQKSNIKRDLHLRAIFIC